MAIQRKKQITIIPADEAPDGHEFESILETFYSERLTGRESTLLNALEEEVAQDGYKVVSSNLDVNVLRVPQVVGWLLYRTTAAGER